MLHSQKPKKERFANRIQVWSSDGRFLFRAHREQAQNLLLKNIARVDDQDQPGKVWRIVLLRSASSYCQRTGDPRTTNHIGPCPDVFLEVVGYQKQRQTTYTFRHLRPDDITRIVQERDSYASKV